MGRPKESLILDGETMLDRQIRLLGRICGSVAVVGAVVGAVPGGWAKAGTGIRLIRDDLPGQGPLGGIATGLRQTRAEFNLFLSCDLPFMTARFLGYLCKQALAGRADVTVPETPMHDYQPLCAVYRRRARLAVQATLAAGRNKVTGFYRRVRVRRILWPEIARADFKLHIFENMNTPAEYRAAARILNGF